MNVAEILKTARAAGVALIPEPDGRLTVDGPTAAVDTLLVDTRAHKAEILRELLAANDPGPALNRLWAVTLLDGTALTVSFSATVAEMQARYPGASIAPASATPIAPPALAESDRYAVTAWLDRVGETDQQARERHLDLCASDPQALAWTLAHLAAMPDADPTLDHADPQAAAVDEAVAERAAILEFDGGIERETAERIAKTSASAFYDHVFCQRETGCGCRTSVGALVAVFCDEGKRLRDAYTNAVNEAESMKRKVRG